MTDPPTRTYRFAPIDDTGLLLGLGGAQCGALGAGIAVAGVLADAGVPIVAVLVPLVAAAAMAFGRIETEPLSQWLAVAIRFGAMRLFRRTRWSSPPTSAVTPGADSPPRFSVLSGISVVEAGPRIGLAMAAKTVAVVCDRRRRCVSASLGVSGREFSLAEPGEQVRLLDLWGDVLGGLCHERAAGVEMRVTEWAGPSGVSDHQRFLASCDRLRANRQALATYRNLLADAAPVATGHELLVTLTIDVRRARRRGGRPGGREQAAIDTLMDELGRLAVRLDSAGLVVGPPLSPQRTAEVLNQRLDPLAAVGRRGGWAPLAELIGLAAPSPAPSSAEVAWRHVRIGATLHRTYRVVEWPRLDCGPDWLAPLLLHEGAIRTLSIHYEPVPPSQSRRRIERDSTRLAADEEQRSRAGFRIGARHHASQAAVAEREAELMAGYAELGFVGFLTVSAPDRDALALGCADYEHAAAQVGIELAPLHGRHDLGLVAGLPLGRGLGRRGWA